MKAKLLAFTTVAEAFGMAWFSKGVALAAPSSCDNPNSGDPLSGGANCAAPTNAKTSLFGNGGIFQRIANVLIFIVAAIAVIMLIIGGLRYVLSGGSKDAVEGAKNTILYAIIGIVVAALAYAAVQFVIKSLG